MEITKYQKTEGKGALLAYLSVKFSIPGGPDFFVNDMKLFQKDGRRWVGFPDKKYEKDGETKYAPYCGFVERNDAFSASVVKALDSYCAKSVRETKQEFVPFEADPPKREHRPSMDECPF
jgi:DNA-binding cell septation regulator SpoVG